jgi:TolB-like protein/Tfp pilus assembly protein PilF
MAPEAQAELERILGSRTFAGAKSARSFLRYVVEETLAGRGDQIKEYVVGVAVFDRGEGYDPRADAVVRVEATRLRNRLREYYEGEGRDDRIRIELPKGAYVPVFLGCGPAAPAPAPARGIARWVAAGLGVLLTLSLVLWGRARMGPALAVHSLAVLPFANASGDPSQDYFVEGIAEGLTGELARIRGLRVIPRSAAAGYRRGDKPPADVLAEGSVARSGDRALISMRLLEGKTLRPLGSHSWERGVGEIPVMQREAAAFIAEEIGAEPPAAGKTAGGDIRRVRPEAYDSYLRGRFYSLRQTAEDNQSAISHLERAVSLDANFASAYAELAQAYVWRLFLFAPSERTWEEKAFVAAEKALSIDPDSAAAHLARGRLLWTPANHFPHEKAIQEYRRAIASDPSLDEARNQLAIIYSHVGLFDQALAESEEGARANPNNHLLSYRRAQTLAWRGQYRDALSVLEGIPPETNPSMVGYQTAWVLFQLGRREEAAATTGALLKSHPEDTGGVFTSVQAVLAAAAGDERTMEAKIRLAVQKGTGFGHFHHTAYHIATAYALTGRTERAIEWLERTAADGFPCYPLFESDHNLDRLRQSPRFAELMAKLKQQWLGYKALF